MKMSYNSDKLRGLKNVTLTWIMLFQFHPHSFITLSP
uniref:Uncharacterized protein n=1 Tax=Arundo donax TaxID=35708 RepID=A0A0A9CH91_ARUDO